MAGMPKMWPLPRPFRINRSFAQHSNPPPAVDLGASVGTPVYAPAGGRVVTATNLTTSYGTHVKIDHPDGTQSVLAHMIRGSLQVRAGDRVEAGTMVGKLGYTGNVDPPGPAGAHLHWGVFRGGSAIDPAVWVGSNAGSPAPGGSGTTKEPAGPPPEPQDWPAKSGLAVPFFGAGNLRLMGEGKVANLTGLVDSMSLDAGTAQVAQLTLTSLDPDMRLAKSALADKHSVLEWRLGGRESRWDIATVSVSAAAGKVQIAARSRLARRLRNNYAVSNRAKASPSEWVASHVKGAGGRAICQPAPKRAEIPQADDQSEWDVLSALAQSLGWSWVEFGGVVVFGSRRWAWEGGPDLPTWRATWTKRDGSDVLDAEITQTEDDAESKATGRLVLPWDRGIMIEPWHRVVLDGLGRWDGHYLVERVNAPNDGVSPVEVEISEPRAPSASSLTATPATSRRSAPPPGGENTPQWAKWYAKGRLAAFGWDSPGQFSALEQLWTRESNWNYRAENQSSGAYGIPQALPASKMATAGKDWRTNAATQIEWGLGYIKGRYGSPKRAWAAWKQKGWY